MTFIVGEPQRRVTRVIAVDVTEQSEVDAFLLQTLSRGGQTHLIVTGEKIPPERQLWVSQDEARQVTSVTSFAPTYATKLFNRLEEYIQKYTIGEPVFGFRRTSEGELEIELNSLWTFMEEYEKAIPGLGSGLMFYLEELRRLKGEAVSNGSSPLKLVSPGAM